MDQYLQQGRKILEQGNIRPDRTGTGTRSLFGKTQMTYDLSQGFPLVTSKFVPIRLIIEELLWILSGDTNNNTLLAKNVHIWDEWCIQEANFGKSFENRELVYVEPRRLDYSSHYAPDSTLPYAAPNGGVEDKLRSAWFKMMDRCYNKEAHNYRFYGGRGIFVCERWHKLENFIEDVKKLPNWRSKMENWNDYSLDKDYYSSNCYAPTTTLWLSNEENAMYGSANSIAVITPQGHCEIYPSINTAAEELGMVRSSMHRFAQTVPDILKGNNKKYLGWKFVVLDKPFRYSFVALGELGPIYGKQWRSWGSGKITAKQVIDVVQRCGNEEGLLAREITALFENRQNNGIDQISELIAGLKAKPYSRRHIVTGWNPDDMPDETKSHAENVTAGRQALPPCHTLFQFYVRDLTTSQRLQYWNHRHPDQEIRALYNDQGLEHVLDKAGVPRRALDCQLYQRSADWCLGVPFNIASYALLTMMVAQCVDMLPGEFIHSFGDAHIYGNHVEDFREVQLPRTPYPLPTMKINPDKKDIFSFTIDDFELVDYQHHPRIVYDVAV